MQPTLVLLRPDPHQITCGWPDCCKDAYPNRDNISIATIIGQYTDYSFGPFYRSINGFLMDCIYNDRIEQLSQSIFGINDLNENILLHILSGSLLSPQFIKKNDERLKFEGKVLLFTTIHTFGISDHPFFIEEYLNCYLNSKQFITLFEEQYGLNENISFIKLIEKSVTNNDNPLSIFFNGNNENNGNKHDLNDKFINKLSQNLDYIFVCIVNKYFKSNKKLIMNIFYQSINSLIYFLELENEENTENEDYNIYIVKLINYINEYYQHDAE